MPARVVIVLRDPAEGQEVSALLSRVGQDSLVFSDPMRALDALEKASLVELLITSVDFGAGKPHGVALCRMAMLRRRSLRTIFVGRADLKHYTCEIGEYLATPTTASHIFIYALGRIGDRSKHEIPSEPSRTPRFLSWSEADAGGAWLPDSRTSPSLFVNFRCSAMNR